MPRRNRLEIAKNIIDALAEEDCVSIKDCRGKEIMKIARYGGDVMIEILVIGSGRSAFTFMFEMKKPYKKNFQRILEQFKAIKERSVQR